MGAIRLVLGSDKQLWQDVLVATAAGIAASAAWWAFFSRYAERQASRLLTRELAEQRRILDGRLDGLVREVQKDSREARRRNFPRAVYPPQELFDLRFNRDLTFDLERSSYYYFAGPSGVWVATRLELRSPDAAIPLSEVKVRIVDPTSRFSMEKAIADRQRRLENAGKTKAEIEAEVRDHLVLSHLALWRARASVSGPICLCYEGRAIRERLELFESSIYDSNIDRNDQERYPLTAAWGTEYPGWGAAFEDFNDPDFADFVIAEATTREDLERHLSESLDLNLEREAWDELMERYDRRYLSRMRQGLELARNHSEAANLDQRQQVGR